MKESILKTKSYGFALRTVKLYRYLVKEKKEYFLSKQILRSGTSIGANIEEANQAQSKVDFVQNFQLLIRRLLKRIIGLGCCGIARILEEKIAQSLLIGCEDVQKMLTSSIKTSKNS